MFRLRKVQIKAVTLGGTEGGYGAAKCADGVKFGRNHQVLKYRYSNILDV